jgi:Flp/Fap pilin component.
MLRAFMNRAVSMLRKENGQGMVEYALLVGLIAVVVIVALLALGPAIVNQFNEIVNNL